AISPRVTRRSGQNRSLAGGLQPLVIPASARVAASAANTREDMSLNAGREGAGGKPRGRTKKAAISPRVTWASAQHRTLAGGLQPRVTPASARAATSAANKWPSVSANRGGDDGRGSPRARTRNAAICPRVT